MNADPILGFCLLTSRWQITLYLEVDEAVTKGQVCLEDTKLMTSNELGGASNHGIAQSTFSSCHYLNNNIAIMESQLQQPEYVDTTSPDAVVPTEPAPLAKLPSAAESQDQWQRIGAQVSGFLAQLPDYIGQFFDTYKQPLTSLALILASIITVRVVLAVIDALNDIPLLGPTFQLVGIGYSTWFTYRYLLKSSTRQELSQELESLKQQVIGSQQLPEQ